MARHRYPRYLKQSRSKAIAKEIGFWALVALSALFLYVFFFWGRVW